MKKIKVLLIQFKEDKTMIEYEIENYKRILDETGLEYILDPVNILMGEELDPWLFKKYDRVIFGGAKISFDGKESIPEDNQRSIQVAKKVEDFVKNLVNSSIPSFGICFGHQLFAYIFGSEIKYSPSLSKTGIFEIKVLKDDIIFDGVDKRFNGIYVHHDVISEKPKKAELLAMGESCNFSLLKYGKNSYTSQFHPELTYEMMIKAVEKNQEYKNNFCGENKDISQSHKILKNFFLNL